MRCLVWKISVAGFLCLTTLLGSQSAVAATPKDAVPDSASIVVRWKAPQDSWGKIADIVDWVQPGYGDIVKGYLPATGQLIGVDYMKGVELDKDIWAVVFAEPQSIPTVVIVVSTKDADTVKGALPEGYHIHAADGFVAYSDDKESLDEVTSRIDGSGRSIWSKIDGESIKTFEAGDLSLLINIKQLAEDFADDLKEADARIDGAIDQILEIFPEDQKPQMTAAFDLYRQLGKSIVASIPDLDSYAGGLEFTKAAIRYQDHLQVKSGSATSKFLAAQPAKELSLVNRLPAGQMAYMGLGLDMSKLIEWSMSMTPKMFPNLGKEQVEVFEKAAKEMATLKYGESAYSIGVADGNPAIRVAAVSEVTPVERARELARKVTGALEKIVTPDMTQTTKLETGIDKINGAEVDRVTIVQEYDAKNPGAETIQRIQKIMLGENGMQQYFFYSGNKMYQSFGGGVAELKQVYDAVNAKAPSKSDVIESRKRFAAKSNVLVLTDLSNIALVALKFIGKENVLPVNTAPLDDLKFEPSFIGYTLSFTPTSAKAQFEFPVVQAQNIATIVHKLMGQ